MKKLISLVLALIFTAAFCFTASAGITETEEPDSFLWVRTEDVNNCTVFNFRLTADDLNGASGKYRIFADVKFVDVAADGGCAYINIYF